MTAHANPPRSARNRPRGPALALLLLAGFLCPPAPGFAQEPQPSAPAEEGPPAVAPAPLLAPAPLVQEEGFLQGLQRLLDKSAADFKASLDESQEKLRKLQERNEQAARDGMGALLKFPGVKIVDGREICDTAPNGSPDCQAAAEKICKAQGFAAGKSADIQTSRKCPARAWLAREPAERACTLETVVVKAACQ